MTGCPIGVRQLLLGERKPPPITLDNSAIGSTASDTVTVTCSAGAVLVALGYASHTGNITGSLFVTGVSCSGFSSFAQRKQIGGTYQSANNVTTAMEIWWGVPAAAVSSQTLTFTWSSSTNANHVAMFMSFKNVNTSNPFDTTTPYGNFSISGGSGTDTMTLTASDAGMILIASQINSFNLPNNVGWTNVQQQTGFSPNYMMAYKGSPSLGAQSEGINHGGAIWFDYMDALRRA